MHTKACRDCHLQSAGDARFCQYCGLAFVYAARNANTARPKSKRAAPWLTVVLSLAAFGLVIAAITAVMELGQKSTLARNSDLDRIQAVNVQSTRLTYPPSRGVDYYVTATKLNVRLCADQSCPLTNRLSRQQKVTVYSRDGEWARVSKYYDSSPEKLEFPQIQSETVARWVAIEHLSRTRPEDLPPPTPQVKVPFNPMIRGLPQASAAGLSENDVATLRKYAEKLIKSGECTAIVSGDKSLSRPNLYFVICEGDTSYRYFKKSDI